MKSSRIILPVATVITAAICWWSYRNGYSAAVSETDASRTSARHERRTRPEPEDMNRMELLSRLLTRPYSARTADEAWALVRGLPERQVKEMIGGIEPAPGTAMSGAQHAVRSMLYHRWAQIDPMEAIESASEIEDKEQRGKSTGSALTAWMKQDADGAFRWMEANPQLDFSGHHYMMANLLFTRPAVESLDQALTYSSEVHKFTLFRQACKMSTSEEDRAAMLTLIENRSQYPVERVRVTQSLAEAWGLADPVAALAGLGSLGLSEIEKKATEGTVLANWSESDPRAVFAWAASDAGSQPIGKQASYYLRWQDSDPAAALAELGSAESRTPGLIKNVMGSLLARTDRRAWGGIGARLGTENPEVVRLQDHYAAWARQAPADAEQWRDSLSPNDRSKIDFPEADEIR